MSDNWAMRSFGKPYFVAYQENLGGMDAAGLTAGGLVQARVEFKVFALPIERADRAELHPILTFSEFLMGRTHFAIGITPDGRVGAVVGLEAGGPAYLSGPGVVTADNRWHSIEVVWDYAAGNLSLALDDPSLIPLVNNGYTSPAAPTSLGALMLFNGPNGISRTDIAIRRAWVLFDGADARFDYKCDEKSGGRLIGTRYAAGALPLVESADLVVQYRQTLGHVPPWGGFPTTPPGGEAYGWTVQTEHTELVVTPTVHTEVAIT